MRTYPFISWNTLLGLALCTLVTASAAAQDVDGNVYGAPSVQFYINRTRGQDTPNVSMRATIQRDLNMSSGGGGGVNLSPSVFQGGGGGGAAIEKPFAHASHRPTVSPYLNLLREDLSDPSIPNYQTLVQPQLKQIEFQQAQQRQNDIVYRQLQQVQARAGFNPQGSQVMLPTGHATTFQYYGSYYPLGRRR